MVEMFISKARLIGISDKALTDIVCPRRTYTTEMVQAGTPAHNYAAAYKYAPACMYVLLAGSSQTVKPENTKVGKWSSHTATFLLCTATCPSVPQASSLHGCIRPW